MQNQAKNPGRTGTLVAAIVFVGIVLIILLIALLNAPTMGGPRVMASLNTYLTEVKATAIPFIIVVGIFAVIIAFLAARELRKVWPNIRHRTELITGYAFIAPYLLVTLTFTIGVILFAFYISFTHYDIFTRPTWTGLSNYAEAFKGFTDSTKRDFLQSLYNVLWYTIIVVPIQTFLAILVAVLLNAPVRFKQFFRTVFYAPSVTSSVVITMIFIWFYLKAGYVNYAFESVLGWVGINFTTINWLGDPRGLIQLIVEAFGGTIPSTQWFFRGPSIAWMAIMFQNIYTTIPTFHDHVPRSAAGYQPNALRGSQHRRRKRQSEILQNYHADATTHYPAGGRPWHHWHLSSFRPGLPGDFGRTAKDISDTCVFDLHRSSWDQRTHYHGVRIRPGLYPGRDHLRNHVLPAPVH